MKNNILLIITLLLTLTLRAQPQVIDKIVAQVGDKIVLKSDVEIFYAQEAQKGSLPDNIRCEMLKQIISQKLLIVQAAHDSIEVSDDEVEQELDSRIRYFETLFGTQQKMEEFYGKTESAIKEEFREQIKDLLLSQRMSDKIVGDITVSPSEVKAFYNKIPKDSLPYLNAEVEYAQIVITPKATAEQKQIAKGKAEEIRKRILNGESFETLAGIYSDDPGTKDTGGDLGCATRGTYFPLFEAAAYKLKPGDVSDVIETEAGYHIIKMIDRQGDKLCLKHILIAPPITATNINLATKKLDSIRTQVLAGNLKFYEGANKYSTDEASNKSGGDVLNAQTQTTFFQIDQLDPDVYYAIEKLQPGEISAVQQYKTEDQKKALRIIMLKSQTQPHIANLKDDYSKIQAAALAEKKQLIMDNWLKQKMKTNYLKIDSTYGGCEELQELVKISANVN